MNLELQEAQLKVLGHEGFGFTEFRNIGTDRFVGINPRKTKTGTKNEDVSYVTCLVVDVDPTRISGTAATEEQHTRAIQIGAKISLTLPNSILVDSGNGCHVYFPIIPIQLTTNNQQQVLESIKAFYNNLRESYEEPGFKIDHIHDFARMIRLWGSINPKSGRECQPLSVLPTEFARFPFQIIKSNEPEVVKIVSTSDERFNQLVKLHPGINKMMSGLGDFESRSEADFAFVSFLTKAQIPLSDIKILAKRNPLGRMEELKEADIERIVEKITTTNHIDKSFIHGMKKYKESLDSRKPGYSTGFPQLDEKLAGIQKGRLYVLAARTNEGKTSFSCNLAYNLVTQNVSVLYFPTELGYEPLFDKLVAQASDLPLKLFQFGNFTDAQRETVNETINKIANYPFIVHEDFGLVANTIKVKSKEICPSVIIIDFIQAMKYEEGTPREIMEVMRSLKELAEEMNVPIIICSQLNRSAINNELSLAQLKGSGSIEEFADVVMAMTTLSKFEYPRVVDLHILKNRYSEVGRVRLEFFSSVGKFKEKGE